jgi:hypothetical protein
VGGFETGFEMLWKSRKTLEIMGFLEKKID